jgi:hypothetical protein
MFIRDVRRLADEQAVEHPIESIDFKKAARFPDGFNESHSHVIPPRQGALSERSRRFTTKRIDQYD